jgi:hypothetical protein
MVVDWLNVLNRDAVSEKREDWDLVSDLDIHTSGMVRVRTDHFFVPCHWQQELGYHKVCSQGNYMLIYLEICSGTILRVMCSCSRLWHVRCDVTILKL